LDTVKSLLLTQKGIRTLSPSHPDFIGIYAGNQEDRDKAYHQGTAWVWLLGHFCEAYLQIH
jgi:glycogen debranching enzyme